MGKIITVVQTPTITAGAYTSGKALGGLLTFTDLVPGGFSKLLNLAITDKGNQKSAVDLMLFNQTFTPTADAATLAISSADLLNCLGVISIAQADYVSLAASTNAIATKLQAMGLIGASNNNIYGQLVSRGTPTYVSTSDIQVRMTVEVLGLN